MAFSLNPLDWFKPAPVQNVTKPTSNTIPGTNQPKYLDPTAGGLATPALYAQYGGGYASTPAVAPSSATSAPETDPNVPNYQNDVRNRISSLQSMYNQLYGNIDASVADRRNQLDQNYNQQQTQLNKDYGNSSAQLPVIYAGRGLSNSSYFENAQNDAGQAYQDALNQLNQGRDQNYSQLGQFAAQQKASLGAGQQQLGGIDVGSMTDPTSLLNLRNQLDQQLASLQQTSAGLGTNAEYINGLNAIAPVQNTGSAKLQQQLATLAQSNASTFAKQQILQGLMRSAGVNPKDENYWKSYFQSLG